MVAAAAEGLAAHRPQVRRVLLRLVRDEALAEDLLQDAMIRAAKATHGLRGEAGLGTWLTAIALNLARDHFRAARRAPRFEELDQAEGVADAGPHPEAEVMQAEMSACILEHVARLPDRQRTAVLMHHFAGLRHDAIAQALETTEGNARVTLHRGLAALRKSLGQDCRLDFRDQVPCERRGAP